MRRSLAWRKAASRSGVQVRDLPGPFRTLVSGASTLAAPPLEKFPVEIDHAKESL